MASAVPVAPNHYEVLGLSPTASQEEIAAAFARAMSTFGVRPVAVAMHIMRAFEVLKDPAKRQAYNRSMGLAPMAPLYRWQYRQPSKLHVPASPHVAPPQEQPVEDLPSAAVDGGDPKFSAFISSLHRLAEPAPPAPTTAHSMPAPERMREPRHQAKASQPGPGPVEPVIEQILAFERAENASARKAEFRSLRWSRPAIAVGGLILLAGVLGVTAGLSVTGASTEEPQLAMPLPSPRAKAAVRERKDGLPIVEAQPDDQLWTSPSRAETHAVRTSRAVPPAAAAETGVTPEVEQAASGASEVDPLAPTGDIDQRTSASMPLPRDTVARTIGRIGYRCGSVASMTPIEGAPGAFKVTCASGDSYRAAPVRGRYHFRRMASR